MRRSGKISKEYHRLTESERFIQHCILSYQLHAQTTFWKIDPFNQTIDSPYRTELFDEMRSVTSGRYLGPLHLEPVQYFYDNISPREGVFYQEGAGTQYSYFEAPSWTQEIRRVYYCCREKDRYPIVLCQDYGSGTRDLYSFEGETGHRATGEIVTAGSRSLMGYVCYDNSTGELDIVFRGSRSGSAVQAGLNAALWGAGNADWVTDLNSSARYDTMISKTGEVAGGFSYVIKSCMTCIFEILNEIFRTGGARGISAVYIAGHSLGGGLAGLLKIALHMGNYGYSVYRLLLRYLDNVDAVEKTDLFKHAQCFTYGSPAYASAEVVLQLMHNGEIDKIQRYAISNDVIVWASDRTSKILTHVGSPMEMTPGIDTGARAAHVPQVIQERLVAYHADRIEDMAARKRLVIRSEEDEMMRAVERLWVSETSISKLMSVESQARSAYIKAFNIDYWTYLWDVLGEIYIKKHHHYKSGKRNIFSSSFWKSAATNETSYRTQLRQAYQLLNRSFPQQLNIFSDESHSVLNQIKLRTHCTEGIVVVAFIQAQLDLLQKILAHKNPTLTTLPSLAPGYENRIDVSNQIFFILNNLLDYLTHYNEASKLVWYAIHHLQDLLTVTMPNPATIEKILDRGAQLRALQTPSE